jgi:Kdo2-lipid IVA lauroyltransferase/acyltransferase
MADRRKALYHFIAPRYWPIWTGLGLLRLVCLLPHHMALAVGSATGRLVHRLAGFRRAIVARNISLCFPELDDTERRALVRRHFEALGMSLVELGLARWASDAHLAAITTVEGVDNVLDAVNAGRGVIMLSAHFTALEISGRVIRQFLPPYDLVYRKNRNPFITEILRTNRERCGASTIEKRDIKAMVRSLRQGRIVWYAPDQSYNRKGAELVPFFGVPCMHTTATSTLARLGKAVTVPVFPERQADGRYLARILPPLEGFPGESAIDDTKRYIEVLERQVRRCPEQYYWLHRKFKNLPAPYPDYYESLTASK